MQIHFSEATRGFTLAELLVAITILALVAVLGVRGLDTLLRARTALITQLDENRQYMMTFGQMELDCAQLAPVSLFGGAPTLSASTDKLVLLRSVTVTDQAQAFQVVTYRKVGTELTRAASSATRDLTLLQAEWSAALSSTATTPRITLVSGVGALQLRTLSSDGAWRQDGKRVKGGLGRTRRLVVATGGASGIEVSLVMQGQEHALLRVFMLGPG
jgi:general secretion pathway protein J